MSKSSIKVAPGLKPATSYLASITDQWLWLPCHEGTGALLTDRAAQYNNGGASPILDGGGLAITANGAGNAWTTLGYFAPDNTGGAEVFAVQRNNAALAAFLNLATLAGIGSLMISLRVTKVADVTSSVNLFDASIGSTTTGGFGLQIQTSEKMGLSFRAKGSGTSPKMANTPALSAGENHVVFFADVKNSLIYSYTNGAGEATEAVTFGGGESWPETDPTYGVAVGGTAQTGGVTPLSTAFAKESDLVIVRFERDVSASFASIAAAMNASKPGIAARKLASV